MRANALQARIERLADRIPTGCKTCRDWSFAVVHIDRDGNRSPLKACPTCRQSPAPIIEIRYDGEPRAAARSE
jgi:hypothetical protein